MANSNFLDKAIEIVQKALDEDTKQNYAEAYKQYQNSLDYFMMAMKYEKNDKLKELIRKRVIEYLDRAEKLKEHLGKSQEAQSRRAIGANGGEKGVGGAANGKKDGDEEDGGVDPETKKLRAGLSSESPSYPRI